MLSNKLRYVFPLERETKFHTAFHEVTD